MDASDPKQVKAAQKRAKIADRQRAVTVRQLMSTIAGRMFVHEKLTAAHIFSTSFALNGLQMAFNEGERNQGLLLLSDIMRECPDQFVMMMREANERDYANERSNVSDPDRGDQGSELADGEDRGHFDGDIEGRISEPGGFHRGRPKDGF